jgi:hypothetical protein
VRGSDAETGWDALREALAGAWTSPVRWTAGTAIALLAAVLPAVVAYTRDVTAVNPLEDARRLASPWVGIEQLPLLGSFPVEGGVLDVFLVALGQAALVLGGAVVVAVAAGERARGPDAPARMARAGVPLVAWTVLQVGLAGVAVGLVAGLAAGPGMASWVRLVLALAWTAATVLVVPAIVLGGRSVTGAVVASLRA